MSTVVRLVCVFFCRLCTLRKTHVAKSQESLGPGKTVPFVLGSLIEGKTTLVAFVWWGLSVDLRAPQNRVCAWCRRAKRSREKGKTAQNYSSRFARTRQDLTTWFGTSTTTTTKRSPVRSEISPTIGFLHAHILHEQESEWTSVS